MAWCFGVVPHIYQKWRHVVAADEAIMVRNEQDELSFAGHMFDVTDRKRFETLKIREQTRAGNAHRSRAGERTRIARIHDELGADLSQDRPAWVDKTPPELPHGMICC
jgi:hypothetical protein